ncbi:hypothetical protein [Abyssibacter sp.]|nr:hypothetical protein [Abyssibacter sp.]
MSNKLKVYLDVRFWILLRGAMLKLSSNEVPARLLAMLRQLVRSGAVICPISETVFIELMKQSDRRTRTATASLIDELSGGVSLVPFADRVRQELCNHVYTCAGAPSLAPVDHLVWTKVTSVFGEFHPSSTGFGPDDELALQKAFYDHQWKMTLMDVVAMLDQKGWPDMQLEVTARNLNRGKVANSQDARSIERLIYIEFYGGLCLFRQDLARLVAEVEARGWSGWDADANSDSEAQAFSKLKGALPTLHVHSCCHAGFRWDTNRKLNGNDLLDFHHATAAIAYCDLLLTEKSLAHFVSQSHLGLGDSFGCRATHDPKEAYDVLARLRR